MNDDEERIARKHGYPSPLLRCGLWLRACVFGGVLRLVFPLCVGLKPTADDDESVATRSESVATRRIVDLK